MGTIVKRGSSYRAVIRRRGFPVKTKTFRTVTQARHWVTKTEACLIDRRADSPTLSSLIDRYADGGAGRALGRTMVCGYRKLARHFAGVTVDELTAAKLIEWATGRTVSRATVSQELTMLGAVLRVAEAAWGVSVRWDEMRKARQVLRRMGRAGKSQERTRRPLPAELDAIKAHVQSTLPMADLIDFAVASAMRLGEIVRIRWEDLDAEKRTVVIRDRKHPVQKQDGVVPLLGVAWDIVQRQPRGDERVFPYKADSVGTAFQRARNRAGVKDLRFHDLRHEGISRLFEQGYAIQEVALVSGHRDWGQLRRYTQLKPEHLHRGPIKQNPPS